MFFVIYETFLCFKVYNNVFHFLKKCFQVLKRFYVLFLEFIKCFSLFQKRFKFTKSFCVFLEFIKTFFT